MIIVLLNYTAPIEALDAQLAAHRDWLKAGVEAGILMAAGRKVPRTGGMLLARGALEAVKAWAATDPFAVHGLSDYDFIEVDVTMAAEGFEGLRG
jgi:uncharacterized protein YciI